MTMKGSDCTFRTFTVSPKSRMESDHLRCRGFDRKIYARVPAVSSEA